MSYDLIIDIILSRLFFVATFLCALTAGFLFAFAVVVMPGLKKLDNRSFIRTFQVIDGVIQNGRPLFIVVWLGSITALIVSAIPSFSQMSNWNDNVIVFATLAYFFGVQVSTVVYNIPLNNKLQKIDVANASEAELDLARQQFEAPWNVWNVRRTMIACLVTALLIAAG